VKLTRRDRERNLRCYSRAELDTHCFGEQVDGRSVYRVQSRQGGLNLGNAACTTHALDQEANLIRSCPTPFGITVGGLSTVAPNIVVVVVAAAAAILAFARVDETSHGLQRRHAKDFVQYPARRRLTGRHRVAQVTQFSTDLGSLHDSGATALTLLLLTSCSDGMSPSHQTPPSPFARLITNRLGCHFSCVRRAA
jgi:hypothetical protein